MQALPPCKDHTLLSDHVSSIIFLNLEGLVPILVICRKEDKIATADCLIFCALKVETFFEAKKVIVRRRLCKSSIIVLSLKSSDFIM